MALDGITVANIVYEMREGILNGRISKISQPEPDELMITVKAGDSYRLLISAAPSLPLIYFTDKNKPGPAAAPNFCMLLRKHIGNGRIKSITQPGLERVIDIEVEHLDELGDACLKHLVIELMGRHSNILFLNHEQIIIDSIKHIPPSISSVRAVLPGRPYFIPDTQQKKDPLSITGEDFAAVMKRPVPLGKALYTGLTGLSPVVAEELCFLASLDSDKPAAGANPVEVTHLFHTLKRLMDDVRDGRFYPNILFDEKSPVEFAAIRLTSLNKAYEERGFESISQVLKEFYATKNTLTRIRQKSSDLRHIVQTALERCQKKYDLQLKQLKDTEGRDKYRIYGELLNIYGYELKGGEKELKAVNYYDGSEVTIPLDVQLTAHENSLKFFDRYAKLKRTFEALSEQCIQTRNEIEHLDSIRTALDIAMQEEDLSQIREELRDYGYIKKRSPKDKKSKITSKPLHYLSSDGFHIYVGKNNYQNEELTFKAANGSDWWFHAKGIPGSHVIVKTEGNELPDRTFEEAGRLAAYYSKGRDGNKVEVDYLERRKLKKVTGAAPGFVIYHTNYSLISSPDITGITEIL